MPFLPSVAKEDEVPHVLSKFNTGGGLTPIPGQFDMEGKLIKEGGYEGMLHAFGIV